MNILKKYSLQKPFVSKWQDKEPLVYLPISDYWLNENYSTFASRPILIIILFIICNFM